MRIIIITVLFLIITGCGSSVSSTKDNKSKAPVVVEIVSHRGINSDDSTIDGFYNAINLGFDSIETDLRMHKGVVVLSHDKTVDNHDYTTLDDFLLFASNNDVKIWIEAKETEVIPIVLNKLAHYDLTVIFSSSKQSDLDLIKSLNPSIETGRVITREEQIATINAEWVIIYHPFIARNYEKIKHLKIAAWTIRDQSEYDNNKHLIDAAISDIELIK